TSRRCSARVTRASCTCGVARAASSGTRELRVATSRPCARCGWTVTAIRSSRSSSPRGRPVTRASAVAFTVASSSRARRARRFPPSSARSPSAPGSGRAAPTRWSFWRTRAGSARRGWRRPRRWRGRRARSPTSASTKRPRTCSTTCWCCCAVGGARSWTPSGCSMVAAPSAPGATPPAALVRGVSIVPDIDGARELARSHNLIPLSYTFIEDCETPVSAFLRLPTLSPGEPAFLLESAEQGQRVGRWSFIGFRPREVLRWSLADGGDPYALAAAHVSRFDQAPMHDAPPFTGGAVGFFGYDLVRTVEPLGDPPPDPLGLPDMALMLSDALVVFDHLKHTVTILANADLQAEPDVERAYAEAQRTIEQVREVLAGPVPRGEPVPAGSRPAPEFHSNMSPERFEAMVARIVEYIYAGDAFQVVPSQRWSARVPIEAFSVYRGLRAVNPSPY